MDLSDMGEHEVSEWNGAEIVLVATGLDNHINLHGYGCAETFDADLAARVCRISMATLTKAPGTVIHGNYVAFPWETTFHLVRRLAYTRYETVLDHIRGDEAYWEKNARERATHTYSFDTEEYERLKQV